MRIKKITAVLLAFVLLFSGIPVTAVQADEPGENQELKTDMAVESEDSFGNMVADMMTGEIEEQEENDGCNIFSVEVEGNTAIVEFETNRYASLIIAVYDDKGLQMLASGNTDVNPGDTEVEIQIDTDSMPEYFYLRGFLVDYETCQPCCTVYESPNYTREMQEFLAMTTEDFAGREILNFDDDTTNNFAVYSENTIVVEETDGVNEILQSDEENGIYVIENADSEIRGLREGDLFSYEYADGTVLIIEVATISTDGTTVTIKGRDTSMEEVFDYVKIDTTGSIADAEIDPSTCDEGVTYEGIEKKSRSAVSRAVDIEEGAGASAPFKVEKEIGNIKISGGIELKLELSVKLYLSLSQQYFELKFDYSSDFSVSFSGKSDLFEIPLAQFGFTPIPGIIVEVTPSFVGEVNASAELSGTISGTVGTSVSSDKGLKNLTSKPELKTEIKGEMKVFIGFSLEPSIKVISKKLVKVSMDVTAGAEASASQSVNTGSSEEYMHECKNCLDGEINARLSIKFEVKLLNWSKLTFGTKRTINAKITDFYWSVDYGEFGFSTCPHIQYRVDVLVKNSIKNPVSGAVVNEEYITDAKGKTSFYLPNGKHVITAQSDNAGSAEKKIKVEDKAKEITVSLKNGKDPTYKVKDIELGRTMSAAVLEDGSLWTWGYSYWGQLGTGTIGQGGRAQFPTKVLTDVEKICYGTTNTCAIKKDGSLWAVGVSKFKFMDDVYMVDLCGDVGVAVKTDGSLWTWGDNQYGQLGDGTTENKDSNNPVKIMDDVCCVDLGENCGAAVKTDGSLWMWGKNESGQFGNGTTENSIVPIKIMDDVQYVNLEAGCTAAVKTDGSLWMWGSNAHGRLTDKATGNSSYIPIKVMENVKSVSVGEEHCAAIQTDGSLWTWGNNYRGALGTGENPAPYVSLVPKKVMEGVEKVSVGTYFTAALTVDGRMWMWGDNYNYQLTNIGSTVPQYYPIDITDMFSVNSAANLSLYSSDISLNENAVLDEAYIIRPAKHIINEDGTETVVFTGADNSKIYNCYIVKSTDEAEMFSSNNLLYLCQEEVQEDSTVSVTYIPKESNESAVIFAAGMIKPETENTPEEPEYTPGDIDENGRVDIADLRMVLRAVCSKTELSSQQQLAADVETDGIVNIADLRKILRFVCGKLEEL